MKEVQVDGNTYQVPETEEEKETERLTGIGMCFSEELNRGLREVAVHASPTQAATMYVHLAAAEDHLFRAVVLLERFAPLGINDPALIGLRYMHKAVFGHPIKGEPVFGNEDGSIDRMTLEDHLASQESSAALRLEYIENLKQVIAKQKEAAA